MIHQIYFILGIITFHILVNHTLFVDNLMNALAKLDLEAILVYSIADHKTKTTAVIITCAVLFVFLSILLWPLLTTFTLVRIGKVQQFFCKHSNREHIRHVHRNKVYNSRCFKCRKSLGLPCVSDSSGNPAVQRGIETDSTPEGNALIDNEEWKCIMGNGSNCKRCKVLSDCVYS